MCLYAIYVVYLINKLARLKLLPGFICLLLCVFLIVVVVFVIATVFFIVLLLFLFFDYFFCLLFESFLAAVVVVAFKCFFFLTASFDLSLIPLCLFPFSPSQSRKRRHFDYTLYFLTLAFRIIGGSAQSSAGGVSRRFSSDASPDLAATEARLLQSMRFYATALLLFFCSFVFVLFTTISQSSVSHGGIFRTIVDSSI